MMGTLQRVEQETVSSQNLTIAMENMNRAPTDATGCYPKNWSSSTPLGGFAREVAAWLGCVDPKHEADPADHVRDSQETYGRHDTDDQYVELDYEQAVAHTNAAGKSTVLEALVDCQDDTEWFGHEQ